MPFSSGLNRVARFVSVIVVALVNCSLAQFAPYEAVNLTTIKSPVDPNVTISYKVPEGVCTTAFDTQEQYTGWVNVPGTFPTNVFFWFVAARQQTSTLTIWLNGGPGSSSMFGFFTETGPCEVVEKGFDRLGTVARDWGWDRASNMLFIDQPNQVGFSYDVPSNGSLNLVNSDQSTPPKPVPSGLTQTTFLNGTFASLNINSTANTTETAAMAIWHMLQGFLGTFPQYNPPDNSSLGVNLFAESYGGKYGPVFADVWEEQNQRRQNNSLSNSTIDIHLTSLGIVNGCVDDLVQGPSYAAMMVNNSYGLQVVSQVGAALANGTFYQTGGCQDLINQCRNSTAVYDPDNEGDVDSVNNLCSRAVSVCNSALLGPYGDSGRSYYDIAHQLPESFPPAYYIGYLNSLSVQTAIGSVVNYTDVSNAVFGAFYLTGDSERGPIVPKMAELLQRGVRVGLLYGDRDFICNWIGGEAISMNLASIAGGDYATHFPAAGYAPIIVNDSYIGGVVRQYGNLSFSRIYQAGHFVPAYQPETAFQVFARVILGTSVSTGEPIDLSSYNTTGPLNATSTLSLPSSPTATCYIYNLGTSCPDSTVDSILAGEGVIINGIWYSASSDWPGATVTSSTQGVSTTSTTTATLTGLFTATSTPKTNAANSLAQPIAASGYIAISSLLGVGLLFIF